MNYKFPKFSQWKQIFKVLKKSEKITLLVFLVLTIGSLIFLITNFYLTHTKAVPGFGGTYVEGVVGQPRFINPIYGETDDVDRSLIDLVYSGLMTYDNQGNIVKDLAQSYTISPDGRTYTFTLKNNVFWDDGQPLTVDDVIFTIKTIQDSDYQSPLRANWIDVDVQKINDNTVSFTLQQPYNSFLENCTLKIIPEHIWQNISPANFALSLYNLQPVGSGPFEFMSLKQDPTGFIQTLNLQSNRQYYNQPSFIAVISFKFFEDMGDLVQAAKTQTVNGFALTDNDSSDQTAEKQLTNLWPSTNKFSAYSFVLPRYFAVFFNNQKTSLLSDSVLRQALTLAVNKSDLVQKISSQTAGAVSVVDSPILPDFYGYQAPTNTYGFDLTKAGALLDNDGFLQDSTGQRAKALNKKPAFQFTSYLKIGSTGSQVTQLQACLSRLDDSFKNLLANETNGKYGVGTGNAVTAFQQKYLPNLKTTGETGAATRQELNTLCVPPSPNSQPLAFTLTTINQPQLMEVANILKASWQQLGVNVTINAVDSSDIKPIIKNRDYDALLYGESLGMEPDLYPFWYSSQSQDPGLNLSSYQNKDVDKLLEDARQTQDPNQKAQDLENIQTDIINDAPALFLYNPDYVYLASSKVQGINTTKIVDPAKRFENIVNWYLQTRRVWK